MTTKRKHFYVPESELFTCGNCGQETMGGRYVNHCPYCLWSKHVDKKIPGDRASSCQGLMEPISATQEKGKWRIIHKCCRCGEEKIVDASAKDSFKKIAELSQQSFAKT